jgi:hypothetical protein
MAVAILAGERVAAQDSVAQFYHGKQITIIVGSSADGGFGIYAELLSRCLPKHYPRGLRLSTEFTARSAEQILSECNTALTTTVLASSASGQT